jgi:hypothetical protein
MLDFTEQAVSAVERMLIIAPPARRVSRGRHADPTAFTQRPVRSFQVLEVIEETGELSWVVSNGYDRAVCNSAALAERVKVALG